MNPRPSRSPRPSIVSSMKKRWRRTWRSRAVVTMAGVASVAGGAIVISQIPIATTATTTAATTDSVSSSGTAATGTLTQAKTAATQSTTATTAKASSSNSSSTRVAVPQATTSGS